MLTDEQIDQMKVGAVVYLAKSDEHGLQIEKCTVTAVETRQHITVKDEADFEFEAYNLFFAQRSVSHLEALRELEIEYVENIEIKKNELKFMEARLKGIWQKSAEIILE